MRLKSQFFYLKPDSGMEFEILFLSNQPSFSQTAKAGWDDPFFNAVRDKLETTGCHHSRTSSGCLAAGQRHPKLSSLPASEIATPPRFRSRRAGVRCPESSHPSRRCHRGLLLTSKQEEEETEERLKQRHPALSSPAATRGHGTKLRGPSGGLHDPKRAGAARTYLPPSGRCCAGG